MEFMVKLTRADVYNIRIACEIAKNMELRNAEECINKTADRLLADRPWHLKRAQYYQDIVDAFDSFCCVFNDEDCC